MKIRFLTAVVFFVSLFLGGGAKSQERSFLQFNVEDGLASDVVYDVAMDEDGFMWFATNCGVSMFDGYGFQNYSTEDGLADIENFEFRKDSKGRLWLLGYSNRLSIIENQKIRPYRFNDTIQKYVSENALPLDLFIDKFDNIFYSTTRSDCFQLSSNGNSSKFLGEHNELKGQELFEIAPGRLFRRFSNLTSNLGSEKKYQKNFLVIRSNEFEGTIQILTSNKLAALKHKNQVIFQNSANELQVQNGRESRKIFEFKSQITVIEEYNSKIYIGTQNGLFRINNIFTKPVIDTIFYGNYITGFSLDFEKGIWVSTLKNGTFFRPSNGVFNLQLPNRFDSKVISKVLVNKSNIVLVGNNNGDVLLFDSLYNPLHFEETFTRKREISSVINIKDSVFLLCANSRNLFSISSKMQIFRYDQEKIHRASLKHVLEFNNQIYLFGKSAFKLDSGIIRPYKKKYFNQLNPLCFLNLSDSLLLIGTNNGLFIYDLLSLKKSSFEYFEKRIVNSINVYNDNFLLANFKGSELFFFNMLTEDYFGSIKLGCSKINSVKVLGDDIWVASEKGLFHVFDLNIDSFSYKTTNYSKNQGLNSNFINDISFSDSLIFVASNNGVNYFNYTTSQLNFPPKIIINKVTYGDIELKNSIETTFRPADLHISFTGLSYQSGIDLLYKYRIQGLSNEFAYTSNRNVNFSALAPGNYSFEIFSRNHSGIWSEHPATFSFTILPPFWQTWWFYSIEGFFSISFIFLLVNWRLKKLQILAEEEKKQEKEKLTLELEALRYRMNPHFLFNTLNSIQSFISTRQKDEAVKYLSRFSRLIRSNLEHSQGTSISAQEEIDMLSSYLELEKMRFNNDFDFAIENLIQGEAESLRIPSMLIQPYVENAVLHGVGKLDGKGLIKVRFEKLQEQLLVTIEDNGPGRGIIAEKEQTSSKSHKSVGMSITNRRLNLLNKKLLEPVLEITDLHKNGKPIGTRVKVLIDLIFD